MTNYLGHKHIQFYPAKCGIQLSLALTQSGKPHGHPPLPQTVKAFNWKTGCQNPHKNNHLVCPLWELNA